VEYGRSRTGAGDRWEVRGRKVPPDFGVALSINYVNIQPEITALLQTFSENDNELDQ
jgi:hypothetical protein